jgi:hypothetical protein
MLVFKVVDVYSPILSNHTALGTIWLVGTQSHLNQLKFNGVTVQMQGLDRQPLDTEVQGRLFRPFRV